MTGRVQHYYWHPVRCRFGQPPMDFYELRHFCASWLFNDLQLPAQDVAHQLGHTIGVGLVGVGLDRPGRAERVLRRRGVTDQGVGVAGRRGVVTERP
jgi:integrase